ncbi:MAG: TlpA disulfide reductase family protein [Methylococcaceae bacterium]
MIHQLIIRLSRALLLFSLATTAYAGELPRETPNCALTSLNDTQPLNLQQFRGKVVYVDFWASWCGPCAQSFPFMNDLDRDLKDQGLQVIGVNLDENIDEAKQFLDKRPASFITAVDAEQQCAKNFDVKAMPSSYLIDRKGVIRHVHLGFRPGEAEEFRILVEQLLAEKPVAP